jgi:hypothetical protein
LIGGKEKERQSREEERKPRTLREITPTSEAKGGRKRKR